MAARIVLVCVFLLLVSCAPAQGAEKPAAPKNYFCYTTAGGETLVQSMLVHSCSSADYSIDTIPYGRYSIYDYSKCALYLCHVHLVFTASGAAEAGGAIKPGRCGEVCDPRTDSTQWIGWLGVVVATLCLGSNYVPVKKFDTGDGNEIVFVYQFSCPSQRARDGCAVSLALFKTLHWELPHARRGCWYCSVMIL